MTVQGTPLYDRVVFERESLRQFYDQVRRDAHLLPLRLSRALRSSFPPSATLIPCITPRLAAPGVFFSG